MDTQPHAYHISYADSDMDTYANAYTCRIGYANIYALTDADRCRSLRPAKPFLLCG
jgi:hypothetical protein